MTALRSLSVFRLYFSTDNNFFLKHKISESCLKLKSKQQQKPESDHNQFCKILVFRRSWDPASSHLGASSFYLDLCISEVVRWSENWSGVRSDTKFQRNMIITSESSSKIKSKPRQRRRTTRMDFRKFWYFAEVEIQSQMGSGLGCGPGLRPFRLKNDVSPGSDGVVGTTAAWDT